MKRSTRIRRKRAKLAEDLACASMQAFVAKQAAIINNPEQRLATLKTLDDPRFQ